MISGVEGAMVWLSYCWGICILMVELVRTFQVMKEQETCGMGVRKKKKKKSLYFGQLVHWTN